MWYQLSVLVIKRSGFEIKKMGFIEIGSNELCGDTEKSGNATGGGGPANTEVDNSQQRILSLLGKACVEGITCCIDSADFLQTCSIQPPSTVSHEPEPVPMTSATSTLLMALRSEDIKSAAVCTVSGFLFVYC